MVVLIVTWLVFNQPPVTSQTTFTSELKCALAQQQVENQAASIQAGIERQVANARQQGAIFNPGPLPQVSAVCVDQ